MQLAGSIGWQESLPGPLLQAEYLPGARQCAGGQFQSQVRCQPVSEPSNDSTISPTERKGRRPTWGELVLVLGPGVAPRQRETQGRAWTNGQTPWAARLLKGSNPSSVPHQLGLPSSKPGRDLSIPRNAAGRRGCCKNSVQWGVCAGPLPTNPKAGQVSQISSKLQNKQMTKEKNEAEKRREKNCHIPLDLSHHPHPVPQARWVTCRGGGGEAKWEPRLRQLPDLCSRLCGHFSAS